MEIKAYFGSRISPNITRTDEGYLICHNVPIARTGWYEYMPQELGLDGDNVIQVYRPDEEVFDEAAMASFTGKPFTNDHPPEGVDPSNFSQYAKGHVTNIRRGKGDDGDLLLADIVANDEQTIQDIVNGKREISAGYECDYVPNDDGTYTQKNIRANHVSLVSQGRAGDRVRIKDSRTINDSGKQDSGPDHNTHTQTTKARYSRMSEIKLPTRKPGSVTRLLAAVGLKHYAMDAEPEDVMDAVDAMAEEHTQNSGNDFPVQTGQPGEGHAAKVGDDEGDQDAIAALKAQVEQLTALVQKALAPKEEDPEQALDAEIERLSKEDKDDDDDESKTIEAQDDEGPVSDPEDRPQSAFKAADSAAEFLKAMKPAIAAIKDPIEKKRVVDAALKAVKGRTAKPSATYQKMTKPAKAQDSTPKVDVSELGREIMKQWNPHYKNK